MTIDLDHPMGISPARARGKGSLPCLDVFVQVKKQHPLRVVLLRVSHTHGQLTNIVNCCSNISLWLAAVHLGQRNTPISHTITGVEP